MDWQAAYLARLINDAAVTAAVGIFENNRKAVFWGLRPQGSPLPAVTLNVITDLRPQHLKGFDALRATRVQADAYALTFRQSLALVRAVISGSLAPGLYSGVRFGRAMVQGPVALGAGGASLDTEQSGIPISRQSADIILWHEGD